MPKFEYGYRRKHFSDREAAFWNRMYLILNQRSSDLGDGKVAAEMADKALRDNPYGYIPPWIEEASPGTGAKYYTAGEGRTYSVRLTGPQHQFLQKEAANGDLAAKPVGEIIRDAIDFYREYLFHERKEGRGEGKLQKLRRKVLEIREERENGYASRDS